MLETSEASDSKEEMDMEEENPNVQIEDVVEDVQNLLWKIVAKNFPLLWVFRIRIVMNP